LQLQINSEVKEINYAEDGFFDIRTQTDQIRSKVVLVTTGFFGNPYIPDIPGLQDNAIVLHSHFYKNPDEYRAKRVAIIGGGNSAAEIALELSGYSQVYLLTRDKLKFFSKTRNLCDIRGISESLLLEMIRMEIIRHIEGIHVKKVENNKLIFEGGCISADSIICATGYSAVLDPVHQLNAKVNPKTKFPSVSLTNESKNIPSLFFAGPLAYHGPGSLFIHGFIKYIPDTVREINTRIQA
jgi:thioredoxin reductase